MTRSGTRICSEGRSSRRSSSSKVTRKYSTTSYPWSQISSKVKVKDFKVSGPNQNRITLKKRFHHIFFYALSLCKVCLFFVFCDNKSCTVCNHFFWSLLSSSLPSLSLVSTSSSSCCFRLNMPRLWSASCSASTARCLHNSR